MVVIGNSYEFADIYNLTTSGGMILTTLLVFVGMILIRCFATLTSMMVGDDSNKTGII